MPARGRQQFTHVLTRLRCSPAAIVVIVVCWNGDKVASSVKGQSRRSKSRTPAHSTLLTASHLGPFTCLPPNSYHTVVSMGEETWPQELTLGQYSTVQHSVPFTCKTLLSCSQGVAFMLADTCMHVRMYDPSLLTAQYQPTSVYRTGTCTVK